MMTILTNFPMPWRTSTNSPMPWMNFPLCRKIGTRAFIIERYSRKSTTSNKFDCVLPCYHLQRLSKLWPTLATQMAKAILTFPMRRHFQPRFPFLNQIRLHRKVATDTYFANCAAFGGATCAQVFWGMTSHMINVYGMKMENEALEAYADFLRHACNREGYFTNRRC